MALIKCKECGHDVSTQADTCPNCGIAISKVESQQLRATKFCSHCGAEIDFQAEVCPKCGVRVSNPKGGKNRTTAILLTLFLGVFGAHKFYLGKKGWGIVYLIFCWTLIPALVALIELIILIDMSNEDFNAKYNTSSIEERRVIAVEESKENAHDVSTEAVEFSNFGAYVKKAEEQKAQQSPTGLGLFTNKQVEVQNPTILGISDTNPQLLQTKSGTETDLKIYETNWMLKEITLKESVFLEKLREHLFAGGFKCEKLSEKTGKVNTRGTMVGAGLTGRGSFGAGIGAIGSESDITTYLWNPFKIKEKGTETEALIKVNENASYTKNQEEYSYELRDYSITLYNVNCKPGLLQVMGALLVLGLIISIFAGWIAIIITLLLEVVAIFRFLDTNWKFNKSGKEVFFKKFNDVIAMLEITLKKEATSVIKSKECGHEVSTEAVKCPNCETSVKKLEETQTTSSNKSSSSFNQKDINVFSKSEFDDGYMSYVLGDAYFSNQLSSNPYLNQPPNAMYLVVPITVRNNDKQARTIPMFKLIDENGAEYETSSNAAFVENDIGSMEDLNPGVQKHGVIIFDVPENHTYKLELYELILKNR